MEAVMSKKSGKKFNLNPLIRVLCILGILVITGLLINEVLVQPYLEKKSEKLTKDLYHPSITPVPSMTPVIPITPSISPIPASNAERDSMGRLLSFQNLLSQNNDTKGWITIPATNIDYVVMQNKEEPLYYLTRDFTRQMQKAGCLFLDYHSSVENDTRNLVIHGHNMKSTNSMFHQLMKFKTLDFYQSCPVFTFDTIY
jgi:sortase B